MFELFGDVKPVDTYEYTPKKISPFDFVNSISTERTSMWNDGTYTQDELNSSYNSWVINMAMANNNDTIFYSNELNMRSDISSHMQYDYLFNSVRKYKRYGKWNKRSLPDNIELIKTYYNYNTEKSIEALKLLTDDQIDAIKASYYTGGAGSKRKKR